MKALHGIAGGCIIIFLTVLLSTCTEPTPPGPIYLADRNNYRIVRIDDMNGSGWTELGTRGSNDLEFDVVEDIEVDSYDRIYVSDVGNNRIVRIDDMDGNGRINYDGGADPFFEPQGVCLDNTGRILIADKDNLRIVRIDDMSGADRVNYSAAEGAPYQEPFHITVDRRGHIYVADGTLNQVVRIDTINGDGLVQYGSTGAGQDEFDHLYGVFCY